jgi:hypothetical protein
VHVNHQPAAPQWRRSSFCDNGNCVEVFQYPDTVAVRNNTRPERHLSFDGGSWRQLLRDICGGRLDR